MKKIVKAFLITALLLSTIIILAGCGNKTSETKQKENSKTETVNTQNVDPIVGAWKSELGSYTYHFNDDGTGDYSYSNTKMEFTYKTEGNKISILYNSSTAPFETEYSIDGDTLNVIDSFGKDTLYKKQK